MDCSKTLKSRTYSAELLTQCPGCQSTSKRYWRTGRDYLHQMFEDTFSYDVCSVCHLRFQNPRPTEDKISLFYPDDYSPYHAEARPLWLAPNTGRKVPLVVKLLRKNRERFGSECTFLDFGFGSPVLLDLMKGLNSRTIGIDVSEESVASGKRAGHQTFLINSSDPLNVLEDHSINIALLNHVFEHLYHPRTFLKSLHSKVTDGGLIHISVPNPEGISARIFRNYWFPLEPRHIMLYSPEVLSKFVKESGFTVETIEQENITKDMSRSLGYLLQEWKLSSHRRERLLKSPRFGKFLERVCNLASRWGMSDRFHLIGRK